MFGLLLFLVIIGVLFLDWILIPRSARVGWGTMATVMIGGALLAVYPRPIEWLAKEIGVGRPVDIILYLVAVVAVRDFFMTRARFAQHEEKLSHVVRAMAHERAELIKDPGDVRSVS